MHQTHSPDTPSSTDPEVVSNRFWHPVHVDVRSKVDLIRRILKLARETLSMELGYFGTFDGAVETYRVVEGTSQRLGLREGSTLRLDQTLCWHVASGQIGGVVPDARRDRVTRDLTPVREGGVASYIGVPVHLDGELMGMLCLICADAKPQLSGQDLAMMRLLGKVVAIELSLETEMDRARRRELPTLRRALRPTSPDLRMVYQPVARLEPRLQTKRLQVRSVEALSRFGLQPPHPVEYWFDLGWRSGIGVDVEMAAVERALAALRLLPEPIRLAVNVSPETLASPRLRDAIPPEEAHRVTVELTEHVLFDDYEALRPGLERVRAAGVSLAIDDLGSGTSNLQSVVELAPDLIKVDISITRGVESDPRSRALIAALVAFTRDTGIKLVTEGVERAETARALLDLGVEYGQGYWLSRPLRPARLEGLRSTA